MEYLFIGGPKDGERMLIEDHLNEVRFVVGERSSRGDLETTWYRKIMLADEGTYFVYLHVGAGKVIEMLIDGYKRFSMPDLLEACDELLNFPQVWINDPDGKIRDECWAETTAKAKAAIAKAKGT